MQCFENQPLHFTLKISPNCFEDVMNQCHTDSNIVFINHISSNVTL